MTHSAEPLPYATRRNGAPGWSGGNISALIVATVSLAISGVICINVVFARHDDVFARHADFSLAVMVLIALTVQITLAVILWLIYSLGCRLLEGAWHVIIIICMVSAPILTGLATLTSAVLSAVR